MGKLSKKCLICNSARLKYYFEKNNFQIYKCKECKTEYVNPLPDDKIIAQVYNNSQYHSEERYDISQNHKKLKSNWQKRLKQITSLGYHQGSLLDVGCATGIFLKNAEDAGWRIEGIETSKSAAKKAANLLGNSKVKLVDFIEYASPHLFDVITLWALIEHVKDPLQYLSKVHDLLRPGGLIVLTIPNVNSVSCKLLKKEWRYYIPPEHLFYFGKKSINYALSRTGFRIVKMKSLFRHIAFFKRDSHLRKYYSKNFIFRSIVKSILFPLYLINSFFHLGEALEIYAIKDVE
jgi:2-polyprenyl-3-methyl-5-hydroxy-6-metoxy-1,4-benzoquinol methylase